MKNSFVILCLFFIHLNSFAQNKLDSISIYTTIDLRTDQYVPIELDLRFVKKNNFAFATKFSSFSYDILNGHINLNSSNASVYNPTYNLSTKGIVFKTGINYLTKNTERTISGFGFYIVCINTQHKFMITTIDISGKSTESYAQNTLTYSPEFEFFLATKIHRSIYLGYAVMIGLKPGQKAAFENLISDLYPYRYYAPGLGYSTYNIYANLSFSLGIKF